MRCLLGCWNRASVTQTVKTGETDLSVAILTPLATTGECGVLGHFVPWRALQRLGMKSISFGNAIHHRGCCRKICHFYYCRMGRLGHKDWWVCLWKVSRFLTIATLKRAQRDRCDIVKVLLFPADPELQELCDKTKNDYLCQHQESRYP